jgi:hypothetical protein
MRERRKALAAQKKSKNVREVEELPEIALPGAEFWDLG